MRKKQSHVFNAVVFGLLFGCCDSVLRVVNLTVGPKPHEKRTYVYTIDGINTQHCMWCPEGAFDNTEANNRTQQPKCIMKYKNISQEIKPFELENNKIPICKVGEVPGCGDPPGEKKTGDLIWSCDPGYSNVYHSVYFSCALIHERSRVVAYSYYCNESLVWQLDFSSPAASTEPSDSSTFQMLLILIGIFGTVVCISLVVCAVRICQKRRRGNSSHNDAETSAFLSAIGEGKNNSGCHTGNAKSVTTSSGSDISVGSEENGKNEREKERQPPYGEENPCSLNRSFVQTDTTSSCHCQRYIGNNCSECCTQSCHSRTHIEDNSAEGCTRYIPQSVHSSQLQQNCDHFSEHSLVHPDRYDDLKTVNISKPDQSTGTDTVRAELPYSLINDDQKYQCLLFRKPLNKPAVFSGHSSLGTDNVPSVCLKVSAEMQNRPTQKDGCLTNGSKNERPNPQGNVSRQRNFEGGRDVSINTYTESGYFDDENDERHNTNLKAMFTSGTDAELRECSACGEVNQQSRLDQEGAKLSVDNNEAQSVYRSTEGTNDLSYEIDNDDLKDLNEDNDDSFDKKSATQQLFSSPCQD